MQRCGGTAKVRMVAATSVPHTALCILCEFSFFFKLIFPPLVLDIEPSTTETHPQPFLF